eukprot:scaffold83031_cov44-Phaeocystis_antarctica.AAC.5
MALGAPSSRGQEGMNIHQTAPHLRPYGLIIGMRGTHHVAAVEYNPENQNRGKPEHNQIR